MAATALTDVIIPQVYSDYVVAKTAELSAFYQAGIAQPDAQIAALAAGGGAFINLPFFNDWAGNDEPITDTLDLTINAASAGDDVAVKIVRGNALGSVDIVAMLAGANPIQALANRAAAFWARKEQAAMISVLEGAFTGPLATTHVADISSGTGAAAKLSGAAVLDGKAEANNNQGRALHFGRR